ncbi:MAG: pantetheine-phosphate adenylyltransferase [Elusimicrobia bacterium]|nr:pantetheine-phosphate adenylyltransferase [Elusimicrobiota bacterium]
MSRVAIYPGSFDPVTRGHMDLVQRACRLFDRLIVAVSTNPSKKHTFSVDARIRMIEESARHLPQVEVDTFSGLLASYLKRKKVRVVIRGLRVVSDLDYEFQMASMNRRLCPDMETVFLMPDEQYTYLASSMVKEVARMGAPPDAFVTAPVARLLRRTFRARK